MVKTASISLVTQMCVANFLLVLQAHKETKKMVPEQDMSKHDYYASQEKLIPKNDNYEQPILYSLLSLSLIDLSSIR